MNCLAGSVLALALAGSAAHAEGTASWTFACAAQNDLFRVLSDTVRPCPRFGDATDAVEAAAEGSAVLVLADGYPEQRTVVPLSVFEVARRKRVRLYVEYPEQVPELTVGAPRDVRYERAVVTSDMFAPQLPQGRIVLVSSCRYVPMQAAQPHLVAAKVAGVDSASFGVDAAASAPLLFDHPRGNLLVATTKLSHFVTGRYLPTDAWRALWQAILARLSPRGERPILSWTPTVRPSFGPNDALPADAEQQTLRRSAQWIVASRSLRSSDWSPEALDRSLTYNTVRDAPGAQWPRGDGSAGVLEGYSSTIRPDGSQPMRYAVRNDCCAEVAMLLASDAAVNDQPENALRAERLVDYILDRSGLAAGPRGDPSSASYGLVGWALDRPGSYWGDDNARALMGIGTVAALSGQTRWNEALARTILANFRTTGRYGFRPECLEEHSLQAKGWPSYWMSPHVHYSPHMQSYLWACYLWAYQQTRFEPLLTRTRTALRRTMEAYPGRWNWILRSGTIERARLLLPLAFLVRVDDTPEHRAWLRRIAGDLLALQDRSGALREVLADGRPGVPSNAAYGTSETSLIQTDGDPVCDLLYSCNFALSGLHEAAAATGERIYVEGEDRLADFLCRIQTRSDAHPQLDGAWYRAFDFRRWDYWASSSDWEWGPWCTETGWSQPWIAGTLALRAQHASLWNLLQTVDLRPAWARLRPAMLPDDALTLAAATARVHAARGKPVTLSTPPDERYPGHGPASLTDGELGSADYHDPAWLGFWGLDLEAVIDLGMPTSVRAVAVRCLRDAGVGIYLPARVEVALSADGNRFEPLVVPTGPAAPEGGAPLVCEIRASAAPQTARYVRLRAENAGAIPAGQPGAGLKAWLFVDEIVVDP